MATRKARAFHSLLGSAFSPLSGMRFGINFAPPGNGIGGTDGGTETADDDTLDSDETAGGNETETGNDPPPAPPPAPPARTQHDETRRLKDERTRAKSGLRYMARQLGIDPSRLAIKRTGDPANPFKVELTDGGDLSGMLSIARGVIASGAQPGKNKGGNAAVELAAANSKVTTLTAQNKALIAYIRRTAVVEPIRAACVRNHFVDDDNGNFGDVVEQLAPLFHPEIEFDEDDNEAEPTVTVVPMLNGQPMINAATNAPHTPDSLVADLGKRKPKYVQAQYRNGPGAGGHRIGGAQQVAPVRTRANSDDESADYHAKQARLLIG